MLGYLLPDVAVAARGVHAVLWASHSCRDLLLLLAWGCRQRLSRAAEHTTAREASDRADKDFAVGVPSSESGERFR